jgi:cellobiose phosphorylase
VWEHVLLAQRHLLDERGEHGLSLIHYGDWCDTMNGVGGPNDRGESVMLSMQVRWGCDLMAELAERIGRSDIAQEMAAASGQLAEAINTFAWDGAWYVRAFDDRGVAVGSANGPPEDRGELRIFLNPQSWAVIAGVAPRGRADRAIASVREQLDTGYGMVLSYPQSTFLKPRIGQMSTMTPGFYENGSVYTHGNCFWIAALAMDGRGEQAWQAIRAVLPDTDNKPNCDGEPFVIPNMYSGPVVARRKQQNLYLSGWRTGSAAWLYYVMVEWILGARAEYAGLRIDPHLPDGWQRVTLQRQFRGDVYDITIDRPDGRSQRVQSTQLDGRTLDGTLIEPIGDRQTHQVHVSMGE